MKLMIFKVKANLNDWWVVQSKLHAEDKVISELNNQGFTTYCPMYCKEFHRGRKITIKTIPLFPRYVFIQANQNARDAIHVIRSTYGVSMLLKIGEMPTSVPNQIIHDLKLIEIQHSTDTESYFNAGDTVKITEGLYQGLEAIYEMDEGLERVVVLLDILNKSTPLHINKNQLLKV